MNYKTTEFLISELVKLISDDKIDLKPSYQRNYIWSTNDQSELIDTILKGFPLPNFFLYEKEDGTFEMVDGQQRSRTIYRYWNGDLESSRSTGKRSIDDDIKQSIKNYKLNITIIEDLSSSDSLEEFYVLVNKKGKHLNKPELNKAEYSNSNFLQLVENLLDHQNLINLNLFTDAVAKRMNDRSFIEELIVYLNFGITDKKIYVDKIYETDITSEKSKDLENSFNEVIDIIVQLNNLKPINKTRFKQRNDFYTLFCFVDENKTQSTSLFFAQYKILIDLDSLGVVNPSNENCPPLREYALNCVSQSNSKTARKKRLQFFSTLLLNKNTDENDKLIDIVSYLEDEPHELTANFQNVEGYELLDLGLE